MSEEEKIDEMIREIASRKGAKIRLQPQDCYLIPDDVDSEAWEDGVRRFFNANP
jgi:hypothetical protein